MSSCNHSRSDAAPTSTSKETDSVDTETASTPTNITGTYLACDYTEPPAVGKTSATLGCRVADKATGHKSNVQTFAAYDWGYVENSAIHVVVRTMAVDTDPWHAYYSLSGTADSFQNALTTLRIGLKEKSGATELYEGLQDLVGKLNILMEGTWVSNQCLPWNSNPSLYWRRTDIVENAQYTTILDYYLNNQCTSSRSWTEKIVGPFIKVTFDGTFFYTDARTDTWLITPLTQESIVYLNTTRPDLSFTIGKSVESLKASATTLVDYSSLRIDEANNRIYIASGNDTYDGTTDEKRKKIFDLNAWFDKQQP